jgi:predicted NodU family carbamoyl transferase
MAILREEVDSWFEQDDEVTFMIKVFQIKEDKR